MKKALITGITGQDGSYLAELLLTKGYEVHGIKRRSSLFNTDRIDHLYQDPHDRGRRFFLHYGDMTDTSSLVRVVQSVQPDEIYNLAAQSHVAVSFEEPEYTANTDALGTLRVLEAIRILGLEKTTRFYQASTSELYGKVQEIPQTRNHAVLSALALCGGQALRLLDHGQLSRGLRHLRLQRNPVQPRVSGARRNLCHPQDHPRAVAHQGRPAGVALHGQSRFPARLGTRPRLRRDAMADAAAGAARGLRHRHRRAAQRARIHQPCRRQAGDDPALAGHGRGREGLRRTGPPASSPSTRVTSVPPRSRPCWEIPPRPRPSWAGRPKPASTSW